MGLFTKKPTNSPRRRQSTAAPMRTAAAQQNVFQRNRTLTGSTSERLSSTHHPTDLQSPRTHVHHLTQQRRKIGSVLLIVLCVAVVLLWLLSQFTARVIVSVSDGNLSRSIDSSLYERTINDYLGANPLSRLRFAMDLSNLNQYIAQTLPEVAGVTQMSLASIGQTDFNLAMRQPVAGWALNSRHYFVDNKGIAFERNYYDPPAVQIVDNSGADVEQGTTVASNRFLGFVGRAVSLAADRGYKVTEAIIPAGTTRQLEMRIEGMTPLARLSIDRPAGEQVEDMSRALEYISSRALSPRYIDVRVSGKAFYQ